jgi:hypothetical protein
MEEIFETTSFLDSIYSPIAELYEPTLTNQTACIFPKEGLTEFVDFGSDLLSNHRSVFNQCPIPEETASKIHYVALDAFAGRLVNGVLELRVPYSDSAVASQEQMVSYEPASYSLGIKMLISNTILLF